MRTKLLVLLAAAALVGAPRAAHAFGSRADLDSLLKLDGITPDTKAACEESGGVWTTVTDEEKNLVGAYCDLAPATASAESWSWDAMAGTSAQSAVARANALVRFYDGRLGSAKKTLGVSRELSTGASLVEGLVARLVAANVADQKAKGDTAAQKRVAVREQAITAWRRTGAAISRGEEEWRKRAAAAAKKP